MHMIRRGALAAVSVVAPIVDAVVHRGRSLKSELAAALPRLPDSRDRALLEAIAFAALRGRYRYAPALRGWLQKPPGANDGPLLALLLAGCAQLDALHQELQTKVGALDPDPLLLQPLDETWRATVEPLVAALDISVSIQLVIDWVHSLPPELRVQIGRVDQAYAGLLASAPGGSGASASASVSVGT